MSVIKAVPTTVICGLGTYTHIALSTGMYAASAMSTVRPSSSLSITVAQSGSASVSVTSTTPSDSQKHVDLAKVFNCVTGDVITFTISSSAAIDNQLNSVKTILSIHPGSV